MNAYLARITAAAPQDSSSTTSVAAQIILYYDEHGRSTIGEDSLSSYLRAFLGFLIQDEVTLACTYEQMTPTVFRRFVNWRKGSHRYSLKFKGKTYTHESEGVSDATIKKNLRIVSAAFNHSVSEQRAKWCPQVPRKVTEGLKVEGRKRVLTMDELGAILGYARGDRPLHHLVTLLLATAMRPEAAMRFMPSQQLICVNDVRRLDLHPVGAAKTKKRNPRIPCIPQFEALIKDHTGFWVSEEDGEQMKALRTRWNTLRSVLGLGEEVVPKTIRHTLTTWLSARRIDQTEVNMLLGHVYDTTTSGEYRHLDPGYMSDAAAGLASIWDDVSAAADDWNRKYAVANGAKGKRVLVDRPVDAEGSAAKHLTRTEAMTPEQREEARSDRRRQIEKARFARAHGDTEALARFIGHP